MRPQETVSYLVTELSHLLLGQVLACHELFHPAIDLGVIHGLFEHTSFWANQKNNGYYET
jgi:hypothetical protein